jgi:hypothetical protein
MQKKLTRLFEVSMRIGTSEVPTLATTKFTRGVLINMPELFNLPRAA